MPRRVMQELVIRQTNAEASVSVSDAQNVHIEISSVCVCVCAFVLKYAQNFVAHKYLTSFFNYFYNEWAHFAITLAALLQNNVCTYRAPHSCFKQLFSFHPPALFMQQMRKIGFLQSRKSKIAFNRRQIIGLNVKKNQPFILACRQLNSTNHLNVQKRLI